MCHVLLLFSMLIRKLTYTPPALGDQPVHLWLRGAPVHVCVHNLPHPSLPAVTTVPLYNGPTINPNSWGVMQVTLKLISVVPAALLIFAAIKVSTPFVHVASSRRWEPTALVHRSMRGSLREVERLLTSSRQG